ncbi:alpha/beta hydrolase fold domain-containing protein [bacterium]|nr:alpha/beta hydrolase fold domain-containing protein [bacterium]
MKRTAASLLISLAQTLSATGAAAGDDAIRLYEGPAPGSENWTHTEKSLDAPGLGKVAFDVVVPTLTPFPADPAKATGTALIICPGGAFVALAWDHEGTKIARELNAKGITCFILKYRLAQCKTGSPASEMAANPNLDPLVAPIVPLGMADGLAAVAHVRKNAEKYGVNPRRIGIMGFSAGGTVAASVARNYEPESRPDFAAPIYPAYKWVPKSRPVPADAPPLFLMSATDDPATGPDQILAMYQDWLAAKRPAEVHIYAKGGHGFGIRKQNLPVDTWLDRFTEWLDSQGLNRPGGA